ncbi:hypothetical protein JCGZ_08449 [Jatropha curcas]|uniref:Protein kinase domain-containing protein n=1 Tax=Jatropha curcas TaxID=180498 RepID=A0A067LDJ3_JATCU|nr:probable inactive receptor kinase At2g26730 [Jatropha curcas]KDP46477.1 hypothetical protein JCGZ_08449 [Jatropha curcas]
MNLIILNILFFALHFPSSTLAEYQPQERDALLQLRDSMNSSSDLHKNWTGPPCEANVSRWFGIVCSDWHVIHLVLEGIHLTGSLPPTFLYNISLLTKLSFTNNDVSGQLPNLTNLVHLESVFLSYNRFTGSIPSEYIELPNLKHLELQQNYLEGQIPPFDQHTLIGFNVSYNHLRGPIPPTDVLRKFSKSSYDHNSNLCGFPLLDSCTASPSASPIPPPKDKKVKLEIWIVVLIAAVAASLPLLVVFVLFCCYKKVREKETAKEPQAESAAPAWTQRKLPHSESTGDPERRVELEFFERDVPVFDLDDLLRASAEVLGKGKLGATYKANLESGIAVAVKRTKNMTGLSRKEFVQQMQLLGNLKHENLVKIVSFYYSKEEKLIVYEFVPNGSLFELLHENRGSGRVPLNWGARLCIIKDIAKALAFLHQSLPSHKVPHANLKSSNVLIHQDGQIYRSKLTNYGFLPLLQCRELSQKLTIGRSPEFCRGKKLSHKTDVYCFGIILLEIITGRIPDGVSSSENDEDKADDLSDWVKTVVNNDWSTDILDIEILASREGHDDMLRLTEIALQCTDVTPKKRPKISEVLTRIQEIEHKNSQNQ